MFGEHQVFECVRCADADEWAVERNRSIGGSDVAAILGLSKWNSPTSVYLAKIDPEKAAATAKDKTNPVMKFGDIMEPVIAEQFKHDHPDILVRRANAILRPIKRPWVHASLDFECREPDGTWGVLEIKCAASEAQWKESVPDYYVVQGQHYLAVTDRSYVWFAVFFRDSCTFRYYRLDRDEHLITKMEEKVDAFWENVVSNTPPTKMVGTDDEMAALTAIYARPKNVSPTVTDEEAENLADAYETVSAQIKALEKRKRAFADQLCAKVGDNSAIILARSGRRVSWIRTERETYDTKAMIRDNPQMAEPYKKTVTQSQGIRIAKKKA